MSLADALATNLRARRGALTQEAFARKLGVSRATLTRLETAGQNVTLETLERICKRLRCDVAELFAPPRVR
jgi:DNA-binding Xre family transcriptional regulator